MDLFWSLQYLELSKIVVFVKNWKKRNYWTGNIYLNCFCKWIVYSIMPSYCKYQYLFCGSYRKSDCCRYFDSFTSGSPAKNKHLYSRHLAFYLVYGSEGIIPQHSRETGISKTNLLIVGLVGETIPKLDFVILIANVHLIIGKGFWLNLFWEFMNRKLYAVQIGEGASLGVSPGSEDRRGWAGSGWKGIRGRIGLAGGPPWVSLSQEIGEGELKGGKGSADQQQEKGLQLLKLLGGAHLTQTTKEVWARVWGRVLSPDPADRKGWAVVWGRVLTWPSR